MRPWASRGLKHARRYRIFTLSDMGSHEQRCCKRLYLGKRVTLAPVLLNGVGLWAKVRAGGKQEALTVNYSRDEVLGGGGHLAGSVG